MNKKINYLSFVFTLITTILIILLVYLLVDNKLNVNLILKHYYSTNFFVAESNEKVAYIISLVFFPLLYLFYYSLFRKKVIKYNNELIKILDFFPVLIILVSCIYFCYTNNIYISIFTNNFLVNKFIYIFTIFVLLLVYSFYKRVKNNNIYYIIFILISFLLLFLISFIYLENNYYFTNVKPTHFEAYFYPIYKIYCGQAQSIDFNSLYGFYGYFYNIVFKLIGFSILKFSIVISLLVFISYGSIISYLYLSFKNKFIAFISSLALLLFPIHRMLLVGDVYYLQYIPHRVLFPMLIILISYFSIITKENKNNKYIKLFGYFISSLAIFWNLDSGIVVFFAYFGLNIYILYTRYNEL